MKHSLSCIVLSITVCFLTGCASNSPVGTETLENNNAETETIKEITTESTTITEAPETTTIIEIDPVEEKFGDRLDQFQGEWKQLKSNWHLIIDGDDITAAYYEDYGDVTEPIDKRYFDLDENDNIVIVRNLNYKGEKAFYNCEINENGNLLVKDTKTPIVNEYEKVRDIDEITLTIP
ncbi:MAG: hypothetical protein IKN39_02120, partial [Clostridia bacterium]|nr:hypothetical protein [Clostridia bacterium]